MRYFTILQDDTLLHLLGDDPFHKLSTLFLVSSRSLRNKIARLRHKARSGDITDPRLYQRLGLSAEDTVIVHIPEQPLLGKVLKGISAVSPEVSILLLGSLNGLSGDELRSLRTVTLPSLCGEGLLSAVNDLHNQKRVNRVRTILKDADNVIILMQNDPDPDAIASGLALRTLLNRNKSTAPLTSMGKVERPENRAMIKLLDIEIDPFEMDLLDGSNGLAMVDVQPPYFNMQFPGLHVVIDHHPMAEKYEAAFRDLRVNYGATSTILTEYLKAENIELSQRLATALLYGIKTDTLLLERETDPADVAAFSYVYPHANHNLIRRMEHPELPVESLETLADALKNLTIKDKALFCHIDPCAREDLIPQFADFCLQVEGVEWSVVSGLVNGNLVLSVRNVGYVRSAGEVVREAFGRLGSAGGHRSMAKAVLPLENLHEQVDSSDTPLLRNFIARLFLDSLTKQNSS